MQAYIDNVVLRSLATPEARHFGEHRKLRAVRIKRGEITGEWADQADPDAYWNPFSGYCTSGKVRPYDVFLKCGTDDVSVVRFMESYGPLDIARNFSDDPRRGSFSLAEFKLERFRFEFLVRLGGTLSKPELLRKTLLESVEAVSKRAKRIELLPKLEPAEYRAVLPRFRCRARDWTMIVRNFCEAAEIEWPPAALPGIRLHAKNWVREKPRVMTGTPGISLRAGNFEIVWPSAEWYKKVHKQIVNLSEARLASAVKRYLSSEWSERTRRVHSELDFPGPRAASRLFASCTDLLGALYWMLAKDWEVGDAPVVCANCGSFFHSLTKKTVYCKRSECKVKGRRTLDWQRHGKKYNANRRRVYARKRRKKRA